MARTSAVNAYPNCLLCGVEVYAKDCSQITKSPSSATFFGGNQRKYYMTVTPAHVVVSSKEVEEAELPGSPRMWSSMCRAMIKSPHNEFFLSGITEIQTDHTRPYIVPKKSPNMARIGGRSHTLKYDDNFIQFYAADIKRQSSQFKNEHIGFIVHAHCWALLNHVIPTTLVEKKMDKFICVAQDYWRDNKSWGSTSSPLRLEKYSGKCLGSMPRWKYGSDIYKNPLIVPGVQKAIDTAKKYKQRHIQPRCSNYSNVPLDIAILIAEWICPININYTPADVRNTRNMLSAWQWELPDGFWKRRLREEDIIFELEAPREVKYSIDWQSLRLDLMALVSDRRYVSSGLVNRVRVLGFMTAIASDFLDMH